MKSFKRVLVYGMGSSGQAACKLLHEHGACVSIYDDEKRFSSTYSFEKNPQNHRYDLVVVSPGIKVVGNELISHFLAAKIPVISELDLGYLYCKGKIIGITGTNGKTTVTTMVGSILKEAGYETFVCGNVGLPISSIATKTTKQSFVVCEVSNFQLELSSHFKADIACVLNIAPDHIDRHGSFEDYIRVKKKIVAKNQTLILNFDDTIVRTFSPNKRNLYFSLNPLQRGVYLKGEYIFYNKTRIMSVREIPLVGNANISNVMAAIAIACKCRVKPKVIRETINRYEPQKHRLQFLGKLDSGAIVVDDSKATNISSVVMALDSLKGQDIILLMGGLNKGCQFDMIFSGGFPLSALICFGDAGKEIASCAKRYGYSPKCFDTLANACKYAKMCAHEGQLVLLSPACASFDEFSSYAVRGERFKEFMFEED